MFVQFTSRFAIAMFFVGLIALPAPAQLAVPRLNSVFPCGARQGTTVECTITGADIADATGLYFSHAGIAAKPLGNGRFQVAVAAGVPVGPYDVRAVTPLGISNFRAFVIGDWPEVVEREPNDELGQAQRVELPVVVNGRIDKPTDLDHYVFAAKKGQRVLINCWAWRIDSSLDGTLMVFDSQGKELAYSGDYYGRDPFIDFTAPADGDYTVKIWDFVYGGSADYFYRLQIGSLPHVDAVLPAALNPAAKNRVTVYGRNLPGGQPVPGGLAIQGKPLEFVVRDIDPAADRAAGLAIKTGEAIRPGQAGLDGIAYRIATSAGSSNPIFLAYTSDPIVLEKEPNNEGASAQKLSIPSDVSGTFGTPGDRDFYSFQAKKGEKVVVEVYGQRQSGTVDPFLVGFDPAGKKMFSVNGGNRNIGQLRFTTNSNDGRWDLTATSDGEYAVQLRDLYFQQRGEARFTYRLSVRRPRSDFRLVVVPNHDVHPDATNVGRGCRQWADVLAYREDGFDGSITVKATGLPAGVTCEPVVIGPGKSSAPLVFVAAKDAPFGYAGIRVAGTAEINGAEAVREARGGGLTWPTVNTPGIARSADSIVLAVRDPAPFVVTATPAATKVAAGGKLAIAINIERLMGWEGDVQLSGFDLPSTNATMPLVTVGKASTVGKVELTLPANLKPGSYTFTVNGAGQALREFGRPADPKKAKGANVRVLGPSNPITVVVEAK